MKYFIIIALNPSNKANIVKRKGTELSAPFLFNFLKSFDL